MPDPIDLDAIRTRHAEATRELRSGVNTVDEFRARGYAQLVLLVRDVPALLAEVARLREQAPIRPMAPTFGLWMTLEDLPKGALFQTRDGILAVKSEYHYGNKPGSQWECILLASGEFAHFPRKNTEEVREVILDIPEGKEDGKVGPEDFARGCEAEQRRIYGCAPHADQVQRLRAALEQCRATLGAGLVSVDLSKDRLQDAPYASSRSTSYILFRDAAFGELCRIIDEALKETTT